MKKILLLGAFALVSALSFGQKTATTTTTTVDYLNAQARIPQVYVQPLVKPLVATVKILPEYLPQGKHSFSFKLTKKEVERDLGGNLANVQNYGVYKLSDQLNCDMIVGATYNLHSDPDGNYTLEVKGFPAIFDKIETATSSDYEWMKTPGTINLSTDPTIISKVSK